MILKHVCITGMDGTGKSTVIKELQKAYSSYYIANIWDLLGSGVKGLPFGSKNEIDEFLCELTPDSRILFLAHAMKYTIDKALQSKKQIIFTDGYFYKYFATEKVLGADPILIQALINAFPVPDIIIELVLPLEEVVKRKLFFSRYECGLASDPNEHNFIQFQEEVRKEWEIYSHEPWYCVSSLKSPEETKEYVFKIIRNG